MEIKKPAFVDCHVHLDLVHDDTPHRLDWLRKVGCLPISWAFGGYVASVAGLKAALSAQQKTIHTIRKSGLACFYLTGIHPRNIPPDLDPESVKHILAPFLDDPICLGIGEIGLEFAHQHEKEILAAQLSMAREVAPRNKIFGVHTPRGNKVRVTQEVLSVLEGFKPWRNSIVVDHCLPETAGDVLMQGFWCGVTLSSGKASDKDLGQIINAHPENIDRLLLNTDSGSRINEDLYRLHRSKTYSDDIQSKLFRENAFSFFGLNTGRLVE